MIRHPLFFIFGILFTGLGIGIDAYARFNYLYGTYVWLDIFVHFITAFGLGFVVLWVALFGRAQQGQVFAKKTVFIVCVSAVLTLGIGWEVVEVLKGMERASNYVFDTTLDISMDLLGALLAGYIASRWR